MFFCKVNTSFASGFVMSNHTWFKVLRKLFSGIFDIPYNVFQALTKCGWHSVMNAIAI